MTIISPVRPLYYPSRQQKIQFCGGDKATAEKGDSFQKISTASTGLNASLNQTKVQAPHKVTILGAGNLGYALLAGLEQANRPSYQNVQSWIVIPRKSERGLSHLATVEKHGGIQVKDTLTKEEYHLPLGKDQIVSGWDAAKTKEIIHNSQTIFVTVPDTPAARQSMLKALLKSNLEGKMIILAPGGEGGVLEAARLLSKRKGAGVTVGLMETSPFGSRMSSEGLQTKWKRLIKIAAFPTENTPQVIDTLDQLFSLKRPTGERAIQFKPVHPVEIILSGQNYIYHVAVVLDAENLRRSIHTVSPPLPGESNTPASEKLDYNHYLEGVTPRIAEIMEELDKERLAIGQAFGLNLEPLDEALDNHYKIGKHARYYDAFQACKNIYHSRVPCAKELAHHRYVVEDLPSVSVIERLGAIAGLPTPVTSKLKETATWNALAIGTEPHEIRGYQKALKLLPPTVEELLTYFKNPAAWSKQAQKENAANTRPSFLKDLVLPNRAKL